MNAIAMAIVRCSISAAMEVSIESIAEEAYTKVNNKVY
jgi:hypothetical protein